MSNNENNHEPFPPIDESELELCKALWISVMLQAVVDARSNSNKPDAYHDRRRALLWLRAEKGEQSDFANVCNLAGLDFQKTQASLLKIVENKEATADFRCIKKALHENRGLELRSKYMKRIRRQGEAREKLKGQTTKKVA